MVLSAEIGSVEWEGGDVGHKGHVVPGTFGSIHVFPSLARLFVRDSSRRNEVLQWAMAGFGGDGDDENDDDRFRLASFAGGTAVYLAPSRSYNVNRGRSGYDT